MEGKKETFDDKLSKIAINGFTAGCISLGWRLGLFKALAKVSSPEKPATPEEVAAEAKCKPRYVKEWLALLATSDIIEVNEEDRFWIKPENVQSLTTDNLSLLHSVMTIRLLDISDKMADVFTLNGPLGTDYSEYKGIHEMIDMESQFLHKKHLISDLLPLIDKELAARLAEGDMMVLDVGCGSGFHVTHLAEHFPKSNFTGIDVCLAAVHRGNQKRTDEGKSFENVAFIQMDGGKMDEDWTEKYDVVFIFDACHDQMRPDLCLKEVYRVLKPGGYLSMLETIGESSTYKNKKLGMLATSILGFSLFHCLPVGSNSPDAICAGAMWGKEMACKMLNDAGFTDVRVEATPQFAINQLYICKKPSNEEKGKQEQEASKI